MSDDATLRQNGTAVSYDLVYFELKAEVETSMASKNICVTAKKNSGFVRNLNFPSGKIVRKKSAKMLDGSPRIWLEFGKIIIIKNKSIPPRKSILKSVGKAYFVESCIFKYFSPML